MPNLPKLLCAEELKGLIESGTSGIKVLDCTYYMGPAYDGKEHYGKQKKEYLEAHIPTAVHFDLDVATYPSQYQRFTRYEPAEFERYARLLGINKSDQLVFYGRGPAGGMLFAARAYWLFKVYKLSYGHENVSMLNGGFEAWRRCGYEAEILSDDYPTIAPGNWEAIDRDSAFVTFEQLTKKGTYGADLLSNPTNVNLLDARPSSQYDGESTGFDPSGLASAGADMSRPTITMCNGGNQASLLAFALENIQPALDIRVFFGSMKEVEQRDPKRISGAVNQS
ncbi:Protein MPST-1 [Aphelenchoides avenae]|nr:Protein MPST-1 [Aphelenchus avenae]